MVTVDTPKHPLLVSGNVQIGALSVPYGFWVVFYTAEDHLRNTNLNMFQKVYAYMLSRLLEIFTQDRYCHVQVFYDGYTHHVPYFGGWTYVYLAHQFNRPFTKAYELLGEPVIENFAYTSRKVSFWSNVAWFFHRKFFPHNCVSDCEYILRTHYTWDYTLVCKLKREYKSVRKIEEAIASGHWGYYRIIVSDRSYQ